MGNNATRGCGNKKPGRCYGESSMGPGGILNLWTWFTDSGLSGLTLPLEGAPKQGMLEINPRLSLLWRTVVTYAQGLVIERDSPPDMPAHLERLGNYALLDHVGENNYPSGWDFVAEVLRLGPSRVIPAGIAVEASKHTPFPIIFSHSRVPVFASTEPLEEYIVEALDEEPNNLRLASCLHYADWGMYVDDWDGWDTRGNQDRPNAPAQALAKILEGIGRHGLSYPGYTMREGLVGASWITKVTYYDDKPTKLPEAFRGGKIRTAVIDQPE